MKSKIGSVSPFHRDLLYDRLARRASLDGGEKALFRRNMTLRS